MVRTKAKNRPEFKVVRDPVFGIRYLHVSKPPRERVGPTFSDPIAMWPTDTLVTTVHTYSAQSSPDERTVENPFDPNFSGSDKARSPLKASDSMYFHFFFFFSFLLLFLLLPPSPFLSFPLLSLPFPPGSSCGASLFVILPHVRPDPFQYASHFTISHTHSLIVVMMKPKQPTF